ncbi:hypothetical protein RG598_06010 [Enterococcus sp. FR211]|uniref:hypothetical protein n=1 Tax=unclassified Enterococcus TaxID=2608891 RepID=UPI00280FCD56|nr:MULTISPECIES: hypothetical protein [unclassified Enterococcus]MDQ8685234.1 hypothetical protein [Enterococcus sp. FR211]MDQ8690531.1 hypothetical protein [Enterococcus sp. FR212]
MKTVNRVFCASHVLSLLLSIYLGVYAIQQPIDVENIVFQMSLTDGLILSVFFFLILFIGNIFGSVANFLNFSIYPLLSLALGVVGLCSLFLFPEPFSPAFILFGILNLFQTTVGSWLLWRSGNLMKIGE